MFDSLFGEINSRAEIRVVGHTASIEYGRSNHWLWGAVGYIRDNSVLAFARPLWASLSTESTKCPAAARWLALVSLDGPIRLVSGDTLDVSLRSVGF